MKYLRTDLQPDGSAHVHIEGIAVQGDNLVAVEWYVLMDREAIADFLRTVGTDPCKDLGMV